MLLPLHLNLDGGGGAAVGERREYYHGKNNAKTWSAETESLTRSSLDVFAKLSQKERSFLALVLNTSRSLTLLSTERDRGGESTSTTVMKMKIKAYGLARVNKEPLSSIELVAALKADPKAHRKSPVHPVKPERRLRGAVESIFSDYHNHVVKLVVGAAQHRSSETSEPLKDALHSAAVYGSYLLDNSPFKAEVKGSADDLAQSARKQTAKSLRKPVVTSLEKQENSLYQSTYDKTDAQMSESIVRAESVYDAWDELTDESEDFEDEEALERRLSDGLSGVAGTAIAAASMYFGYEFGQMIKEAQTDNGVSEYTWVAMGDFHTRTEHEALSGETCSWDDPPLAADKSDSGEACHPGEDFNCRCVASPIDPDEEPS